MTLTMQYCQALAHSSCITNSARIGPPVGSIHTGDAEHGTILSRQVNTIEAPLEDIAGTSLSYACESDTLIDRECFCCWDHNNSAARRH